MKLKMFVMTVALMIFSSSTAWGQEAAGPEYDVFKKDVGAWDAKAKMWMGPGEPEESEGFERNRMVGDFWLVTDFRGKFGGVDFIGVGTMGYNAKTQKYEGTWIDSMSPNQSTMTGTYDEATKTFTAIGEGTGPDGNPMKNKNVTVYKDDGSRVMTMYSQMPGNDEMMKTLEIIYTKRERGERRNRDE